MHIDQINIEKAEDLILQHMPFSHRPTIDPQNRTIRENAIQNTIITVREVKRVSVSFAGKEYDNYAQMLEYLASELRKIS